VQGSVKNQVANQSPSPRGTKQKGVLQKNGVNWRGVSGRERNETILGKGKVQDHQANRRIKLPLGISGPGKENDAEITSS